MQSVSGAGGGRFCPNGHAVAAGHRFCARCGSAVLDSDATVAMPMVDPTVAHGIPAHPPAAPPGITPPPPVATAPVYPGYPPTTVLPGAAPPPPPAPPTPTGPVPLPPHEINRRPGPGRGALIAMAVAGLLLIGGLGTAAALLTAHAGGHQATGSTSTVATSPTTVAPSTTATTVPTSTTSAGLQDSAAITAIAGDLSQSAAVRPSVQNAINGVVNCSVDPGTGESTLQQSIDARQNILSSLGGVDVSGIPQGQAMVSDLQQALTASVQADHDYQKWMEDEANSGQCSGDPSGNSNFQAGQAASAQATAAKTSFLAIWNSLAPNYGQPTYTATQI